MKLQQCEHKRPHPKTKRHRQSIVVEKGRISLFHKEAPDRLSDPKLQLVYVCLCVCVCMCETIIIKEMIVNFRGNTRFMGGVETRDGVEMI